MYPFPHDYGPDSHTFNHHFHFPPNSTQVGHYTHIDYEVNTIVGQIENIYDDLKDTTEIEQLRAVQQWVQMYPNTGESMNKCVYDVVKKAIRHIREDLISSANKYINDVIPDNSSLSGNDPNATHQDVIAAKVDDIHDIIEGIKNPNNPSFPKDATKACSAHNNAFGVVTASGVNSFIEKIKSLKKELDKIPEGTCSEKHKSRRKHNHRHSSKIISNYSNSRSMSINSNSSTHNTRKKHNHSSFSKSMN